MLSIIIVNYKTSKDLIVCLDSIKKYEKNYKQYEIVIVDNNSDDNGLEQIKDKFPFVKIIYAPRNGGFSYGNNIGIKITKEGIILLLNPDTYLKDNSIEKLYIRMRSDPEILIAGPKLLYADGRNQSYFTPKSYLTLWRLFCMEFFINRIFIKSNFFNSYFQTYMDYDKERFVEQVSGAVFMFKRSLIDKIGLLDENYFMFFEESDFCLQALKKGYKLLYYPESKVIHIAGQSTLSGFSEQSNRYYIESSIYFFKKNYGLISAYISILFLFIGSLLRVIILSLTFNKKYILYYYYIKNLIKYLFKKTI